MRLLKCFSCICCFCLFGCAADSDESLQIFSLEYDFSHGLDDWTAGFTGYPVGETIESDSIYQWEAEYTTVPGSLDGALAVKLSCNNLDGDIFMFLKKKIENLRPNTNYTLVFDISLATNATTGQGLILKAGGSEIEPKKVIENGYYSLNIDKGEGLSSGENLYSFGDVGGVSYSSSYYVPVTRGNANSYQPLLVKSNSKGEIWLIVGTESQYVGMTTVFYSKVTVIFSVSS